MVLLELINIRMASASISIYLYFYLIILPLSESQQYYENKECLAMLSEDYRKYEAPVNKDGSAIVSIKFWITNLDDINEGNMDFRLHGHFQTTWQDTRLKFNGTTLRNSECAKYIWIPHVIFGAVEHKDTPDIRENLLRIEGNIVRYSQRFSFRIGCKMYFKDYPFDTQFCKFPMKLMDSHFFNVTLKWQMENGTQSLYFTEEFKPLQFFFRKPAAMTKNGELAIQFVFVRQLMGSFINIFMPSTLIVTVSWVSFWIRVEAAPARVALSVTSLLTLCTQIQNHRSLLPPLNYIIALDIWLFVCIFMVFANLVEFAISYNSYVIRRVNSFREPKESGSVQRKGWIVNIDEDGTTSETISQSLKFHQCQWWYCGSSCGDVTRIDLACRIIFPLSFTVFSVAYWWHYLSIYNYQKE